MGGHGSPSGFTKRNVSQEGPKVVGTTSSAFSSKGEVPLIENNVIGSGGDYQGKNMGSGKAASKGPLSSQETIDKISEYAERHPNAVNDDALSKVMQLGSQSDTVTVFRATPSDSINHGDWVFLTEAEADSWARATFSKKPKAGYSVVKAKVPATMVGWTGKNLEFVIL